MNKKLLSALETTLFIAYFLNLLWLILQEFNVPYVTFGIRHAFNNVFYITFFALYTLGICRRSDTDPKPSCFLKFFYIISIIVIILLILAPFISD